MVVIIIYISQKSGAKQCGPSLVDMQWLPAFVVLYVVACAAAVVRFPFYDFFRFVSLHLFIVRINKKYSLHLFFYLSCFSSKNKYSKTIVISQLFQLFGETLKPQLMNLAKVHFSVPSPWLQVRWKKGSVFASRMGKTTQIQAEKGPFEFARHARWFRGTLSA